MEAKALYDFEASQTEELGFRKGDQLLILSPEGEEGWVRGLKGSQEGYLPESYIQLEPHPWLVNCNNRDQASEILLTKTPSGQHIHPDGVFLLRPSKEKWSFSLSVKHGNEVVHYKVMREGEKNISFYLWYNVKAFSINHLIETYRTISVSSDPARPIHLMDPQPVYEAIHDFQSTSRDELKLTKGDIIRSIKVDSDDGWAEGSVAANRGLFPLNYAREIYSGSWW